ncbi:MAG: hypothetical protein ABW174_02125 [Flavitalea sp.]
MINESEIKFIRNADIDRVAYDRCVAGAANTLIYAWSFYLDRMSQGWDLLAVSREDNYEYVMPLVSRRKWGVAYLYQPTFVQQLGIFSANTVTPEIVNQFINIAKDEFAFAEIHLNSGNSIRWLSVRSNFILDLSPGYDLLSASFTRDLKNNLKLSSRTNLVYTRDVSAEVCLKNFQQEYSSKLPAVTPAEYSNFAELCRNPGSDFQLVIRGITNEHGHLVATALMPRKQNRLYLLQSWVSLAGRAAKANHYLMDQVIREFAGSDLLLDFEGSDVPGIAAFYRNFGAIDQPYYFLQWNNLPFMLRKIKEIKDGFRKTR